MLALALSVFVAALLGSVHCAAMCGSFACLASGAGGTGERSVAPESASAARRAAGVGTATYSLGRLIAYVLLGTIAGAAGAGLDALGGVAGFTRPAAVVAGVLLMLWGVASLLSALGARVPSLAVPPALASALAAGVRAVRRRGPAARGFVLGLLTGALPCGWLYAFVATAAAAGSAAGGALVMAAFWAGTVPLVAAVGLGAQRLLGPARRHLPAFTAIVLVVLGSLTVAGRFTPRPAAASTTATGGEHGAHHGR